MLSPTPETWDRTHTCDPTVIKGEFKYNGETYNYLMAYLGCVPLNCKLNETGLAVAKDYNGPWIKCNGMKDDGVTPINPIVPYKDVEIDNLLDVIARREHGLALYVFTKNKKWAKKVMSTQQYGGGCVNEVCLHLMVKGVPFNGTGHSGMGAYHGIWGFREFTHPSTVLFGSTKFNLSLREHPYNQKKKKMLGKFLK